MRKFIKDLLNCVSYCSFRFQLQRALHGDEWAKIQKRVADMENTIEEVREAEYLRIIEHNRMMEDYKIGRAEGKA